MKNKEVRQSIAMGILLFIGILLVTSGCASGGGSISAGNYEKYYTRPDVIRCPSDMVAYCEGRQRRDMECTCIKDRDMSDVLDQLRGLRF